MEQPKRVRRSEAAWREIIARQAQSGRSAQVFCRDEGLSRSVFTRWRSRLTECTSRAVTRRTQSSPTAFVEVGEFSRSMGTIRLELGSGIVLTISR